MSSTDLSVAVKKATSQEESAPKRKHVRNCIVYTWDHKTSRALWNALKIQPVQGDEVQAFKALIMIHKVLQEGHPSALVEAQRNIGFIESFGRVFHGDGFKGYGRLIREYDRYLLQKLNFHKLHPAFNGMFEYEEYISLKSTSDPNEGYEVILDLMSLQDSIDDLQKLIFASITHTKASECKISALTPLIAESYGIYKFCTSMLRAMHSVTGSDDALEPLRTRYASQHHRLFNFYSDCQSLRYLTSLITIPRLTVDPPDLFLDDDGNAPRLPKRRENEESSREVTPSPAPAADPAPVVDFWSTEQAQQQYEAEQLRLQQEREAELARQQQLAAQQQQQFEEQQRQQAEAQRLAQEQLLQQQVQAQAQGRVAELERDILNLRGQFEKDQLMLQQYDQRVRALETELAQVNSNTALQINSKDDMIKTLQEQINLWKSKYEALAKLYSQLRQEHLDLLNKYKQYKQKAASAQEAIEKREKAERDLKTKNLELADLIRERDRARYELDKVRGGSKDEVEKLERDIRLLKEKLDSTERSQSSNLSLILKQHQKEVADLEKRLSEQDGSRALNEDFEFKLRDKDEELEILQESLDTALQELANATNDRSAEDSALNDEIDKLILDHLGKLTSIIDSILLSSSKRIQDALFELDSPMQAGNQNSSPEYLLSVIEKASISATDFATAFNNFVAEGPNGDDHSEIINTAATFTTAVSDIVLNTKGIVRLAKTDIDADNIIGSARRSAQAAGKFFNSLLSENIKNLSVEEKTDKVIDENFVFQEELDKLFALADTLLPRSNLKKMDGDLGELVDREMESAADAIAAASERLTNLLERPQDPTISEFDMKINRAILAAAIAVTNAIALLIRAATESQREIVSQGRGSDSRTTFYKKNNRWTEGLISAAKAVAASTNILIETADGVLNAKNSPEQLIVASNEVAASTAQLVAASRVKATFMSKTQDRLESASKAVTSACRSLVNQVQEILSKRYKESHEEIDYSKFAPHVLKTTEMEQQVEILKLQNELEGARKKLGEIRKYSYKDEAEEGIVES